MTALFQVQELYSVKWDTKIIISIE